MKRDDLEKFLNEALEIEKFTQADYGPNGLQIEGTPHIERVALSVSATRDSIAQAIDWKAHALVAHHGLFWKFHGARPITGDWGRRVIPLIRAQVNLFGYHLPLDAHLQWGNGAGLARACGLREIQPFGPPQGPPLGAWGKLPQKLSCQELQAKLQGLLGHPVLMAPTKGPIHTLGIITGGARNQWALAKDMGLDAYLTGEMSEHNWHESQEAGVAMFAGGHNATEEFGVKSLAEVLSQKFSLETVFFPSPNPA